MLSLDCIREIAYRCYYDTTLNILKIFPNISGNDFWKNKCQYTFPDQKYLTFYSGKENYLLREINNFVLAIDFSSLKYPCENILYEYNEMLDHILDLSSGKIDQDFGWRLHKLIHINVEARFVLLYKDIDISILSQNDNETEVSAKIKNHFNNINDSGIYLVVDMNSIRPFFWKYGKLAPTTYAITEFCRAEDLH